MGSTVVKRGDVFYADMNPVIGSEQGGIRPVLIIQNDIGNKYSPTVIVAPITNQINKAKLPTHVEISKGEKIGLNNSSVILLEQVRTLDKRRLKDKLAHLSVEIMQKVNKAWIISCSPESYLIKDSMNENFVENYYRYKLDQVIKFIKEDAEHEFKEIKGSNAVRAIKSNVGEYITSFLNSNGGTIYYGISDDKRVKGINLNYNEKDEIKRGVFDAVGAITPNISPDNINLDFRDVYNIKSEKLHNVYVLEVQINPPIDKKEVYVYKDEIHLRVNGVKKKLQGYEIVDYIRRKTLKDYI